MNNPNFFHFSALPLSTRMVYTMTLLVLGTGYLFAMLQVFYSHAGLDGNPKSISAQDIRIAYHGSETDTRLVSALKGPMAGMLPEDERARIFKWVDSGASPEGFESDVKPVLEERCIACHDGSNPHQPTLTSYEETMKMVAKDTGATIPTLVRVSHIHLFGITFIFFIVSSIFTHAYMRPAVAQMCGDRAALPDHPHRHLLLVPDQDDPRLRLVHHRQRRPDGDFVHRAVGHVDVADVVLHTAS
jgi:hypothetical protein